MLDNHKSDHFQLPCPRQYKPRCTLQQTNRTSYPVTKRTSLSQDRNTTTVTKIVKLIGNMDQNIDDVLEIVGCTCGSQKQFKKIAKVYCEKIQKLRKQRDQFKTLYIQTLSQLEQFRINKRQQNIQIQFCGLNSVNNEPVPEQLYNKNIIFEQLASQENLLLTDKSLNVKSPTNLLQQKKFEQYLDMAKQKDPHITSTKKNKRQCKENQMILKETKKNKAVPRKKQPHDHNQGSIDVDPLKLKYGITKKQLQQYIQGALWTKQMNENLKNTDFTHPTNVGKFVKGPKQKMEEIKMLEELGTRDSFNYPKRR